MKPLTPYQEQIFDLLVKHDGNRTAVARELGKSRGAVREQIYKMEKKGHEVPEPQAGLVGTEGYRIVGKSELYGPDGETKLTWVKTAQDKNKREELLRETVEAMKESLPREAAVNKIPQCNTDLMNVHILTDYHLGMYAWGAETGADWDLKIAEDTLTRWIHASIKASPKAHTAVLAQLGDFIHFDGLEAITPEHRNVLDSDTRFQLIVKVAIRSLRRLVRALLKRHERVILIMAEGNHDPASSAWLRELFLAFYEDEPRVTVDDSPNPYYCIEHGQTSLFFHHGHKRKPQNIDDVMVAVHREVFGRTKHSYCHMGHLHHNLSIETNLMTVEQHRTLAAPDAYAARGGWIAGRDAKCITYHKEYGEVGRVSITPEMLA